MQWITKGIHMGPHPDSGLTLPSCPRCGQDTRTITLAQPGLFVRVWMWLIGHGWMPSAMIILNPCQHLVVDGESVRQAMALAGMLEAHKKDVPDHSNCHHRIDKS